MSRPVVALHLTWGCYGFWLPNDPRGSWSTYVGNRRLHDVGGPARTVSTSRSLAKSPHDRQLREATRREMNDPPVRLTGKQAKTVALAIGQIANDFDYRVFACCVMPDHVHVAMRNTGCDAKQIIGGFKAAATRQLNETNDNPRPGKKPWVKGG